MKIPPVKHNDPQPIAIYNADEQSLIAVFACKSNAVKFIYGSAMRGAGTLADRIQKKTKIHPKTSQLPMVIAVRNANPVQLQELGGADFYLIDQRLRVFIPKPGGMKMKEVAHGG